MVNIMSLAKNNQHCASTNVGYVTTIDKSNESLKNEVENIGTVRAIDLMSNQPTSLINIAVDERLNIVISSVRDEVGREVVVSRFGDMRWNMRVFIETSNTILNERVVVWPTDISSEMIDDIKAAFFVWWQQGRKGWGRPKAVTLNGTLRASIQLFRYLFSRGVFRASEISPLHVADYLNKLKIVGNHKSKSYAHVFRAIDIMWEFRDHLLNPMTQCPWGAGTFKRFVGESEGIRDQSELGGKTPVVPPSVQSKMFLHCEDICANAKLVLDMRDAGLRKQHDVEVTQIRDAILFLVMICSGMRASEVSSMKSGCWRVETVNGVKYHWIRTVEHKTNKGVVDFLIPPELFDILPLLERFAAPLQTRMREEVIWLKSRLAETQGVSDKSEIFIRIHELEDIVDCLFLGLDKKSGGDSINGRSRINVLSTRGCWYQLRRLTNLANAGNWNMANHQCRRTFAWNVARSRIGKYGLIFLKWQFKHTTMSPTPDGHPNSPGYGHFKLPHLN
jgi:hypothetical protein